MIFSQNYQIKWHDTDACRRVHPTGLLVYMQETANRQLEELGPPLEKLRDEDGKGFILSRLAMSIYEPLHAYDNIEAQTWITDSRGYAFNRCFRILREGKVVAEAFTTWALLEISTGKFVKVDDFKYNFGGEAPLEMKLPMRIKIPRNKEMKAVGERKIVYSDIDYNMHMNNTKYPNMLCDHIPDMENRTVKGMTLSFVHEAALGKALTITSCEENGVFYFRTLDESGTVCLEAEVITEKLR